MSGRRPARGTLVALLAALAAAPLARPPVAAAHGIVIDSTPRDRETVAAPPARLVIRFNSRLEKHLCTVSLVGPQKAAAVPLRQESESPPDTLIFLLPALKPGPYQAQWKVLAADGHVTEGRIAFTVAAGAAAR